MSFIPEWVRNEEMTQKWRLSAGMRLASSQSFLVIRLIRRSSKTRNDSRMRKNVIFKSFPRNHQTQFPSSEKCFNFGTMGIDGQANDTEWLENDKNDCGMIGMSPKWDEWRKNDVDDCHIIWIDQNWDEWRSNDMNESRMRWMTVEWCEWLLNDRNDYRMIRMTIEW